MHQFSHSHLTGWRSDFVPASRGAPQAAKRALRLVSKGRINVSSTVQHAHDVDATINRGVEDDVPPERKAAHIGG